MSRSLEYGVYLSNSPTRTHIVLSHVSATELRFHPIDLAFHLDMDNFVDLSTLGAQTIDMADGHVTVTWRMRIYTANMMTSERADVDHVVDLDPHRFVATVPAAVWQSLIHSDDDALCERVSKARNTPVSNDDDRYAYDATTSSHDGDIVRHHCQFRLDFTRGQVLQCQLSGAVDRGMARPQLQLLTLSERLDLCMEHRVHPARCFGAVKDIELSAAIPADLAAYQRSWQAILDLEAMEECLDDPVVIYDCNIKWQAAESGQEPTTGQLQLPTMFCKKCKIFQAWGGAETLGETLGFLCVRYKSK